MLARVDFYFCVLCCTQSSTDNHYPKISHDQEGVTVRDVSLRKMTTIIIIINTTNISNTTLNIIIMNTTISSANIIIVTTPPPTLLLRRWTCYLRICTAWPVLANIPLKQKHLKHFMKTFPRNICLKHKHAPESTAISGSKQSNADSHVNTLCKRAIPHFYCVSPTL